MKFIILTGGIHSTLEYYKSEIFKGCFDESREYSNFCYSVQYFNNTRGRSFLRYIVSFPKGDNFISAVAENSTQAQTAEVIHENGGEIQLTHSRILKDSLIPDEMGTKKVINRMDMYLKPAIGNNRFSYEVEYNTNRSEINATFIASKLSFRNKPGLKHVIERIKNVQIQLDPTKKFPDGIPGLNGLPPNPTKISVSRIPLKRLEFQPIILTEEISEIKKDIIEDPIKIKKYYKSKVFDGSLKDVRHVRDEIDDKPTYYHYSVQYIEFENSGYLRYTLNWNKEDRFMTINKHPNPTERDNHSHRTEVFLVFFDNDTNFPQIYHADYTFSDHTANCASKNAISCMIPGKECLTCNIINEESYYKAGSNYRIMFEIPFDLEKNEIKEFLVAGSIQVLKLKDGTDNHHDGIVVDFFRPFNITFLPKSLSCSS